MTIPTAVVSIFSESLIIGQVIQCSNLKSNQNFFQQMKTVEYKGGTAEPGPVTE
jgi:hypothetical protein